MSDGPSMCAANAHRHAEDFIKKTFSKVKQVGHKNYVPAKGTVLLLYEARLDHIVEIITDRKVVQRYRVKPTFCDEPVTREPITSENYAVGGVLI